MTTSVNLGQAVHYRWEDLAQDHPMPKIARRRIMGEKVMLSEVRLGKGFAVQTHAHANEQMAIVLSGEMRFGIGAEGSSKRHEIVARAGDVIHLPPNVPHSAEAIVDSVLIDVFSPPSEKTGVDERR